MFDSLITSKTRIKLIMRFFINSNANGYLRNLATEFGESTNAIRQELNRFEEANLLSSSTIQNKKYYKANTQHPFYGDLHRLILKYIGIDEIVDTIVKRIGNIKQAYITDDFAQGRPGNILDLVLVGSDFNQAYLNELVKKTEANVSFKIRYITITETETPQYIQDQTKTLLIWSSERDVIPSN